MPVDMSRYPKDWKKISLSIRVRSRGVVGAYLEGDGRMKLIYFLAFCAGFVIGLMIEFERWGVPPPPSAEPRLNRKLIEFYKNQH